jgi:hypothetical protein
MWLIPVVVLVLGWFAFGMIFNLRRGDALLRWLQSGLPQIGERTTFRWLGTSVVELVINQAKKPFRRVETLIVLVPRDIPWMWLMASLQGRRDTLVFRANLTTSLRVDLELADPSSWTGRIALTQTAQRGWEGQPYDSLRLSAPRGTVAAATTTLAELSGPMQKLALHYWRFSLRREPPHLEVHIAIPDRRSDAAQFVGAFLELARAVSERA